MFRFIKKITETREEKFYDAIRKNDHETVQRLVRGDLDANAIDAVIDALDCADVRMLRILLDSGIDPNCKIPHRRDQTPLHHVCEYFNYQSDSPEKIKALLEKGADINGKDKDGKTPLHCAAYNCYSDDGVKITILLLDLGADASVRDNDGKTAAYYAQQRGNTELGQLISEKTAQIAKEKADEAALLKAKEAEAHEKQNHATLSRLDAALKNKPKSSPPTL